MQKSDKVKYDEKSKSSPVNDDVTSDASGAMPTVRPISRQQNENFRQKVLTRKRKRSKHPLRDLRIRAGYTLEELAHITDLSPSYLSRLESGSRRLNADILQGLSLALGCNPADLLPYNNAYYTTRMEEGTEIKSAPQNADMPIYTLQGNSKNAFGSVDFSGKNKFMTRPSEFLGVAGAFACEIEKANFGPRYQEGDRILLHPSTPLSPNCSIVTITKDDRVFVGRFVAWNMPSATSTPSHLVMEVVSGSPDQAPSSERKILDHSDVKATYRIMGIYEAADFAGQMESAA